MMAAGVSKAKDGKCDAPGECLGTCDCYDKYGMEFSTFCELDCWDCGMYWQCVEGMCEEKCGSYPLDAKICMGMCGEKEICGNDFDDNCNGEVDEGCPPCVPEGEMVGVFPGEPECCPGLVPIPCDEPVVFDDDWWGGECMPCDGASFCTACGNGKCKFPENYCNCPKDCKEQPPMCTNDAQCETDDPCTEGFCENGMCVYAVIPNCGLECKHVCDCYELYGTEFKAPCPLMCPTCDNYWSCQVGQCLEECGPMPEEVQKCLPVCLPEEICNNNIDDNCDGQVDEGCDNECVPEGGTTGIYPGAPPCCEGLVQIPCDKPAADPDDVLGKCLSCEGAAFCTACGNGVCDEPENPCNCPEDCKNTPACANNDDCDDSDPCTSDLCMNGLCLHQNLPDCWTECTDLCDCYDLYGEKFQKPCPLLCLNCGNFWQCIEGECVETCDFIPKEVDECLSVCLPEELCDNGLDDDCDGLVDEDCPGECLPEGEGFMGLENQCCEGLEPIWDCEEQPVDCTDPDGTDCGGFECSCPKCLCYVCTKCGDGNCGAGENKCSCPEDCLKPGECIDDEGCADDDPCTKDSCDAGNCIHEKDPNCPSNCWTNEMCPAGSYCRFPDEACYNAKSGSCVEIPWACPDEWKPVCGCDGKTYAGECQMEAALQSLKHVGECKEECFGAGESYMGQNGNDNQCCPGLEPVFECIPDLWCDENGVCEKTCACPDCYCFVCVACGDGICGAGENFCTCEEDCGGGNEKCTSNKECDDDESCTEDFCENGICIHEKSEEICGNWLDDDCDGEIDEDDCTGKLCGGIMGQPCPVGSYCKMSDGTCDWADDFGLCTEIPDGCSYEWKPVCGCDGKTYGNECAMEMAQVSKDHDGGCKNDGL